MKVIFKDRKLPYKRKVCSNNDSNLIETKILDNFFHIIKLNDQNYSIFIPKLTKNKRVWDPMFEIGGIENQKDTKEVESVLFCLPAKNLIFINFGFFIKRALKLLVSRSSKKLWVIFLKFKLKLITPTSFYI